MIPNRLKDQWAAGQYTNNIWATIGSSYAVETLAHQGWHSITIDRQHGIIDDQQMVAMLTAIATTSVVPLVRVAWNDPALIMQAADAGAWGIICPTINSRAEANAFVGALRYAPLGYRSLGPSRAKFMSPSYAAHANDRILAIAQIETAGGLAEVELIAQTPGLDMLYIGPSDLGLSLGRQGVMDQTDPIVVAAIDRVLAVAKTYKKRTGIYCISPEYAESMIAKGFDLVTVASDVGLLSAGEGIVRRFTKAR